MTATELLTKITDHLESDGVIVIATYTRAWQYDRRHIGMFREHGGNIEVQQGKSWNTISHGGDLVVGLRAGRYA